MTPILDVRSLSTVFDIKSGLILRRVVSQIHAVNDVSFSLDRGETLGIVGESGSGKSTLARTILHLEHARTGEVIYGGKNILACSPKEFYRIRRKIQIVFQDPESSLNPKMTVFDIVSEGARNFRLYPSKSALEKRVRELFGQVGLPERGLYRYPHEFSGGQKQRIGIARALILDPEILIADEPVSALDLSIQAQILNLFRDIQKRLDLTLIFIAHNLAVIRNVSTRIIVMYLGKIMESAPTIELFERPAHPYTRALIESVLPHHPDHLKKRQFVTIKGEIPSPSNPPSGCVFRTRCPKVQEICRTHAPSIANISPGHACACHFPS